MLLVDGADMVDECFRLVESEACLRERLRLESSGQCTQNFACEYLEEVTSPAGFVMGTATRRAHGNSISAIRATGCCRDL